MLKEIIMVLNTGKFENLGFENNGDIQSELLTAIARSAEDLTNGRGWPDGVNELLKNLGKITGVSRVWIFQTLELTNEYIVQDYTFEWASRKEYIQIGFPAFNRFKTKINQPVYKDMIDSRKKGEYQKIITDRLQTSWLKSNQEKQNIKSMLTIPVTVENEWWGTLGFDDCERDYEWSDAEIALLRTTGFLISSAVLRDKLSAKRKQLDILQQLTACSAWQFDLRRGYLWSTSEIFNSTPGKTHNLQFSFRDILKKIHPNDRTRFLNTVRNYLKNENDTFRCDIQILMECGDYRWVELTGTVDKDHNKQEQLAGIAIDITRRKNVEGQLKLEATTDPLTGVLNRRKMELVAQKQLDLSIETGDGFSFLMLDLDHFKRINDTYGHPTGDKILIHFVNICRECLRKNDYFARIGGEEFAILLPEIKETETKSIGNRIRETVERTPFEKEKEKIYYTVSIGYVVQKGNLIETSTMYELADSALYNAKRAGRNRVFSAKDYNFNG